MRARLNGLGRVLVGTTAIGAGLLLAAGPASAHVGIGEGDYHAGSYVVVPFSVPHGCDGSPTTKLRIKLPESVPTATPTVNPGWTIEIVKEALDTPLDLGEGRTLTERVTEIDYTAIAPLPDGYRDVFELSLQLPADSAGSTLAFPTIQECAEGSTEWTQIPDDGQDPEELEHPAPSIAVIESEAEEGAQSHDHEADAGSGDTPTTTAAPSDDVEAGSNSSDRGLAIAGLATGVIGMGLGGRALVAAKGSTGSKGSK